ncbi:BamF1: coenzyme F420 non-reducing hydrogenase, delta subunit [Desulfosarcina variabilis str. Montpellier]
MCSGRVDLEFIFRAFLTGQDGVFIGGCKLDECNYITHGNYDALSNTYLSRKIMQHIGLNPERLRIRFMSGADGNLLAEETDKFTEEIKALGPIGQGEGMSAEQLKFKLETVRQLVPYMKLVERERLRFPAKSKAAYDAFFTSPEFDRLFEELIINKLAISQITTLLKDKPLSTAQMADILGLNPSDLSRHINSSSRQRLIRYDEEQKSYTLA